MQQYLIDELRLEDYTKIKNFLDKTYGSSGIENIYRILIPPDILSGIQVSHTECQPYHFFVNLKQNAIAFELLVRSKNKIRCLCIRYATEKQRNWLIHLADSMFAELDIIT